MPNRLDHFMYAGADLPSLIARFYLLSGVEARHGGTHPGLGTRNALASLGSDVYLELIAPDPAQTVDGTYGAPMVGLRQPKVFAYVVKSSNLEKTHQLLGQNGIDADLLEGSRVTPDGKTIRWGLILPRANRFGEYAPKFIDWRDTTHPAKTSIQGCALSSFEIGHPDADTLGEVFRSLDVVVPLARTDRPSFRAVLATPRGALVLTGSD
jgi:hypothetical protein